VAGLLALTALVLVVAARASRRIQISYNIPRTSCPLAPRIWAPAARFRLLTGWFNGL
jgi:hypothetical protein